MNTDQLKQQPMNENQLEDIKKEIIQTYLYLVSRTGYDPKVIEIMKLSALADVGDGDVVSLMIYDVNLGWDLGTYIGL